MEIATSGSGDTAFRVPLDVANLLVASSGGAEEAPKAAGAPKAVEEAPVMREVGDAKGENPPTRLPAVETCTYTCKVT